MIKVAILYICTGRYNHFFSGFYDSCEKFFLKNEAEKDYFVFTDDLNISSNLNVHIIKKECRGFPMDSLFRFEMFLEIEDKLKNYDYIYFFNSNMFFVKPIGIEFLPTDNIGLSAVIHPGFYNRPSCLYPFERSKKSTAYIKGKEIRNIIIVWDL